MAQLQVIVPKLNKRTFPVQDVSDKSNIVGEVFDGFIFESKSQLTNNLGLWYQDKDGYYYWSGGVSDNTLVAKPAIVPIGEYQWAISKFGVDKIWETTKGNGVKVAILDTGINDQHAALKASIQKIEYAAYNEKVITTPVSGDNSDIQGHGTECAGMITGNDAMSSLNCTGVSPDAKLFIYKIYNDNVGDDPSFLATGVSKAIQDNVNIISISRAFDATPDVVAGVQNAIANKIFVIVSAGNIPDGVNPLTSIKGVITVGGVNADGSDILKNGTKLNAAGNDIISCCAPGISIRTTNNQGDFSEQTGTSFATPFVAGLFALKLSKADLSSPGFYDSVLHDFNNAVQLNGSNCKIINAQTFIL